MVRVERGNVVLRVEEDTVQHYLQLGYSVTDENGKVLKEAIPTDFSSLQKAYLEQVVKIAQLEETVAKLTAELAMKKPETEADKPKKRTSKKAEDN